ncbi:MAG: phage head morphogenesis protein [Candidatus Actinomarinaceae bacterium]
MAKINIAKYYKENARLYRRLSIGMRDILIALFDKYSKKASKSFQKDLQIPAEFYTSFWSEMYKQLFDYTSKIDINTTELIKRIRNEQKEEIIDDKYRDEILAQRVTQITETTRKNVQKAIEIGISEGLAIGEIASQIQKNKSFNTARAKVIARTETHTAMNYYIVGNAKKSALKNPKKQWMSANDDRSRDWHRAMNGRQVPIDDDFIVLTPVAGGGVVERPMSVPSDPKGGATNVIQCRCFVLPIDERDELLGDWKNE